MTSKGDEGRKSPNKTVILSKVRRSIGEWETAGNAPPKTTPTTTKASQPAPTKAGAKKMMTPEVDKSRDSTQLIDTPPRADATDRTSEARACLSRAKTYLNSSRNLKAEIRTGVIGAIDQLYRIVKDLEKTLKEKKGSGCEMETEKQKTINGESAVLKMLSEQNKSLQENNTKIEELKKLIENQNKEQAPKTYAAVTSNAAPKPPTERITLQSIIVASEDENDTGEHVLNKIRESMDAKEGWIKVERVRKARNSKVIMSVRNRDESDRIIERLENSGMRLTCKEIYNKDPLLILTNVLASHDEDDIITAFRNQNRHLFKDLQPWEDRMEFKYRRRARNPLTNHVIIRVSPQIWKRAMDSGTVHIDLQRVRVEDQSPLVQCTRCLGFGHSKRYCSESVDSCSHCGGPHLRSECAEWLAGAEPSCKNCRGAKHDRTEHNAFSGDCPVRKRWDVLARSSVAYS